MIFELKFKDEFLSNVIVSTGSRYRVSKKRETGEGKRVLVALVEEHTELSEDHPKFLPSVAVLELAE